MTPQRSFHVLLVGSVVSYFGSALGSVAVQVLAVKTLAATQVDLSVLSVAPTLCTLLCSLSLASWVEYRKKRPVMQLSLLARCVLWCLVPVLAAAQLLTIPVLVAVAFLVSLGTLAHSVAAMAHLRDLVGQDEYAAASGRLQSGLWLSLTVGPLLGGVLTAVVGPLWVIALDAASFFAAAVAMHLLGKPEGEPQPKPSGTTHLSDIAEGLKVVGTQPMLRLMLGSWAVFAAGTAALTPLTTYLYLGECGFSPDMYGVVMAVGSLAGCASSWFTGRLTRRLGDLPVHVWFSVARTPWQFLAAWVPSGYAGVAVASASFAGVLSFSSVGNVAGGAVRAQLTPPQAMARVSAVWQFVPAALSPLLIYGAGWVAHGVGTRPTIVALSVLLTISALMLLPLLKQGAAAGG